MLERAGVESPALHLCSNSSADEWLIDCNEGGWGGHHAASRRGAAGWKVGVEAMGDEIRDVRGTREKDGGTNR